MSDIADTIAVTFNVPVAATSDCSQLIDAAAWQALATASGVTSSPVCTWTSSTALAIAFAATRDVPTGTPLRLNGGVVARADSAAFTMPYTVLAIVGRKQPPHALLAVMTPSGNSIAVTFDGPSSGKANNVSSSAPCELLLANTNLGLGATCVWTSAATLTVSLGFAQDPATLLWPLLSEWPDTANTTLACSSTTAYAGSVLELLPGVVTAVPGGVSKQPAQCVVVLPPENALPPLIALSGATRLGSCDDLRLDAGGTIDFSGRQLAFSWATSPAVYSPDGTMTPSLTTAALYAPRSWLNPGSAYNVTLTVSNFLGGVTAVSEVVVVATVPLPLVSIDGNRVRSVYPGTTTV